MLIFNFISSYYINHIRTGRIFSNIMLPVYIFLFVFFTTWPLMTWAEPGNPLTRGQNYFWYFVVTASTVGYGDYFPHTEAGHIIGAFFVVGSIICAGLLLGCITEALLSRRSKYKKGLAMMRYSGHIVIFGYNATSTRELILRLREKSSAHIILCSTEDVVAENPVSDVENVHFVRGRLDDPNVHHRAGPVSEAAYCIVDVVDDYRTLNVLLRLKTTAPGVRLVAAVNDPGEMRRNFSAADARLIDFVRPDDRLQLADIATTPGVACFLDDFKAEGGDVNSETITVDARLDGVAVGALNQYFGPRLNFTTLWVISRDGVQLNLPPWSRKLQRGEILGYGAPRALSDRDLASLRAVA